MRILLILAILPVVLLCAGTAAADPEDPYFVRATPHDPELPAERDPSYDCAGEDGPEGAVESVEHDLDALTEGERWGLPYVAPGCLAVDARADDAELPPALSPGRACGQRLDSRLLSMQSAALGSDPCRMKYLGPAAAGPAGATSGSGESSVRITYDLDSGRYFVHLDPTVGTPLSAASSAAVLMFPLDVSGDSGVSVQFDCVECPPPWEQ